MEFEWDEAKSAETESERGISFEMAALLFADASRIKWPDERHDYGEERWLTTGVVDGECLTVVYPMRGEVTRIISARPASRKERHSYGYGPQVIG